jgi:hypothetical protein
MMNLDFAIRSNTNERLWTPWLLLFGAITMVPFLWVMVVHGTGDGTWEKLLRILLGVMPLTGLCTGLLYLLMNGLHGAILEIPLEGDRERNMRGLEGALENIFSDMGLKYSKGIGRPERRLTYLLPEGIKVQIFHSDFGDFYKGEPYNLTVRIYRVFEKNKTLAREIVRRVDSMAFLDSLTKSVRTDITDDPGFWEI